MTDQKSYREIEAVNWSSLKYLQQSPLHYRSYVDEGRDDTVPLGLGRALHTAVFEPDEFPLEYVIFDGKIRRGKEWDAFKKANENKTILKRDEYRETLAKRDAVRRHPVAARYLIKGEPEKKIEWTDAETGLRCKARLDWLCGSVLDLKGTKSVDGRKFGYAAAMYGYHCQLAFYREGVRATTGRELDGVIIAVEHERPHDVGVFLIGDDEIYAGWEECRRLLKLLAECRESNHWPGRYESAQPLSLPNWIWGDEDDATGLDLDWSSTKSVQENRHEQDS